jgi:sarcosine oxidase subunit alpha
MSYRLQAPKSQAWLTAAQPNAIGAEKDGLEIPLYAAHQILITHGGKHITAVTIRAEDGTTKRLGCDLLAISGGWNPTAHLFSQSRGTLAFDDDLASFVPDRAVQKLTCVGAAAGMMNMAPAMAETVTAIKAIIDECGFDSPAFTMPTLAPSPDYHLQPLWHVDGMKPGDKAFVDIQNDVTLDDIGLAMREGFDTVEHVKRYTTAGMGIDQGKSWQC